MATDAGAIHDAVRDRYATAATSAAAGACCGTSGAAPGLIGSSLYEEGDRDGLPAAALVASLGCGNPTMMAELRPGDVVLDLGSGGGIDVLLSARRVAPGGHAFGLDMTPEMLELAEKNRVEAGVDNAEFLLGTIEDVPLPDSSVDIIISNCVVNLSPDKDAVLREAFRVLRPGGRLAISDIVLRKGVSEATQSLMGLWTGCVAGALTEVSYAKKLAAAGFSEITIEPTRVFETADLLSMAGDADLEIPDDFDPDQVRWELADNVMSAFVRASKPASAASRT